MITSHKNEKLKNYYKNLQSRVLKKVVLITFLFYCTFMTVL